MKKKTKTFLIGWLLGATFGGLMAIGTYMKGQKDFKESYDKQQPVEYHGLRHHKYIGHYRLGY